LAPFGYALFIPLILNLLKDEYPATEGNGNNWPVHIYYPIIGGVNRRRSIAGQWHIAHRPSRSPLYRHSRVSGNPDGTEKTSRSTAGYSWIPALSTVIPA